jgi:hypothetical protein
VRREDREDGEAEMADPRSRAEPDREPGDRDGQQGQQQPGAEASRALPPWVEQHAGLHN